MPVPDFQSLMRPVLQALAAGQAMRSAELRTSLIEQFKLTDEELAGRMASGQSILTNRVAWTLSYLYRAGLLDRPQRGVYSITTLGRRMLTEHPGRIDLRILRDLMETEPVPRAVAGDTAPGMLPPELQPATDQTPDELMGLAHRQLMQSLSQELLEQVLAQTSTFFERVVLDVLTAMGYGGTRPDAVRRLGRSGDEGVDGVIDEDRLGLDSLYVQAKRYALDRTVGRPDVQAFVGALQGQRARKGVLITTGRFTEDAKRYADAIQPRVVLVDGTRFAELMIEHNVGVAVRHTYAVQRIDQDYFTDPDEVVT